MIEADNITGLQSPGHALYPPVVVRGFARIPAVKRIAPSLACGAECIGRNAGHYGWLQFIVQVKKFRMPPYVGAIVIYEDRYIANYLDSTLHAIMAKSAPLLKECKLHRPLDFQLPLVLQAEFVQGLLFATSQPLWPCAPGRSAFDFSNYLEQNKIFQPPRVVALEIFKSLAVSVPAFQKILRCPAKQRQLGSFDCFKVNSGPWSGEAVGAILANPSMFGQAFKADQERIPGKG